MTIKELEQQREEHLEHKDKLKVEKILNEFNKKVDIQEQIRDKVFEEKYGYKDEFCTENFNKELKNEAKESKSIKFRKFKNKMIKVIIVTSISGLAFGVGYFVGNKKGLSNGKQSTIESIEKEHLKKNDLSTVPNMIVDKWADVSLNRYYEYAKSAAKEGNDNQIIKFENIKNNEYSQMKSAYQDYLETGSNESYIDFRNGANHLQDALNLIFNDDSFDFNNSVFAYAVLVDSEGNIVDKNIDDNTLQIYIAKKFDDNKSISSDEIVDNGIIYEKYDSNEYSKQFSNKKGSMSSSVGRPKN